LAIDLIHLQVRSIQKSAPEGSRDKFIALNDVSRLSRVIQEENIRLHPEDAISTRLWVDKLRSENVHLFYKDKLDQPPQGSRLQSDAFMLCFQTNYQLNAFQRLGNGFIGIDATHNITQYQDLLLFTIIARDHWGHGM
jgi:hypothetical protein